MQPIQPGAGTAERTEEGTIEGTVEEVTVEEGTEELEEEKEQVESARAQSERPVAELREAPQTLTNSRAEPALFISDEGISDLDSERKQKVLLNIMEMEGGDKEAGETKRELVPAEKNLEGNTEEELNDQPKMTLKKRLTRLANRAQRMFRKICQSTLFEFIVFACISVNTVTLSLDRYPISPQEALLHEDINYVATWIFIAELLLKIFGLGVKMYFIDSINQFDAVIVLFSIIELVLQMDYDESQTTAQVLTIFRGFRLLRVFRLVRKWDSFHKMMVKISQTLKDIFTFFVLLLLIIFVYSLLGVELFSN